MLKDLVIIRFVYIFLTPLKVNISTTVTVIFSNITSNIDNHAKHQIENKDVEFRIKY